MPKEKEMDEEKCRHMHRGGGIGLIIIGILVLINAYSNVINWVAFIGIALILIGIFRMIRRMSYQ